MKSVKGPPLIEISSTAPSRPLGRSKVWSKYKLAPAKALKTKKAGEYKLESVTQPGASWNAQLGGEVKPVVLVFQFVPNEQVPVGMQFAGPGVKEDPQPGGNAGAMTPSKSSCK